MDCQEKKCSRKPVPRNPTIALELAAPAQMPTALLRSLFGKAVVNTDKVAGMISAAPIPATARATMIWTGLSRNTGAIDADRKDRQPDEQGAAPSVPIADRACGQQQARQHQGVTVDHPGQLRLRRAGRHRHVG